MEKSRGEGKSLSGEGVVSSDRERKGAREIVNQCSPHIGTSVQSPNLPQSGCLSFSVKVCSSISVSYQICQSKYLKFNPHPDKELIPGKSNNTPLIKST